MWQRNDYKRKNRVWLLRMEKRVRLLSIALSRQNENRQSDTEAPRKPDNSEKQAKTNVKTEKTSEKLAKAPEKANGKRNKKK